MMTSRKPLAASAGDRIFAPVSHTQSPHLLSAIFSDDNTNDDIMDWIEVCTWLHHVTYRCILQLYHMTSSHDTK